MRTVEVFNDSVKKMTLVDIDSIQQLCSKQLHWHVWTISLIMESFSHIFSVGGGHTSVCLHSFLMHFRLVRTLLLDVWVKNIQYSASVLSLSYQHLIEYCVPNIYCVFLNQKNKPPLRKPHHIMWRHHNNKKVPRHDYVGGKTFL